MTFDFAGSWPIQLLLLVVFVLVFVIGAEFWRRYVYINLYFWMFIMIISIPFLFYPPGYHGLFFISKFFVLVPILVWVTMVRIAYTPTLSSSMTKWKLKTQSVIKILFCMKIPVNSQNAQNTSKFIEWFLYILWVTNFVSSILLDLANGYESAINTLCGIILVLTIPLPAKIAYPAHSYYVDVNGDFVIEPVGILWIICYSSWNYSFLYHIYGNTAALKSAIHILPPLIHLAVYKRADLWLVIRMYSLSLFTVIFNPYIDDWKLYILHGANFPNVERTRENNTVFVIWDSINLIMLMIYGVIWISKMKKLRDTTADELEAVTDKETVELLDP